MHPNPPQRERVESEIKEDISKPINQLLADVHDESVNANSEHAPLARAIARFASLLVVLSKDAEKRAERLEHQTSTLINLTRSLKVFTIVVVILTIGLLVIGGFQLFKFYQSPAKSKVYMHQIKQTDTSNHNTQNSKK